MAGNKIRPFDKACVTIYIMSITVLLIARDVIGIPMSKMVFIAISAMLMFAAEVPSIVYMVSFITPLLCGIPGTYILLIAFVLLVLKIGRVDRYTITMCALMLILEFFASIWYSGNKVIGIINYFVHVAMLFVLLSNDILEHRAINRYHMIQLYMMGSLLLCLIIIVTGIQSAPENWLELYSKGWFRFGNTQLIENTGMTISLNPNNLGYYGMIGFFFSLHLFRKQYRRILNLVLCIVHFAAGILSLSRSFLVMWAICVVIAIVCTKKTSRVFGGLMIGLIGVGIILYMILHNYPDILAGWITRMTSEDMATGNGRTTHMLSYFKAWVELPRCILVGAGVVGYKEVTGLHGSMHNAIQQILICYGFLGTGIFLYGLIQPVRNLMDKYRMTVIDWLPVLCVVLFVQTIQFVNPTMLMLPYAIALHAVKIGEQNWRS